MPRFVRPGFISGVDNPRERSGWARATVTVRTADGGVSDPVTVSAGGMDSRTSAGRLDVDIPAGFQVEIWVGGRLLSRVASPVEIIARPEE